MLRKTLFGPNGVDVGKSIMCALVSRNEFAHLCSTCISTFLWTQSSLCKGNKSMVYKKFRETGSVSYLPRSYRSHVSETTIENVWQSHQQIPKKSMRNASRELQILPTTVVKIQFFIKYLSCMLIKCKLFRPCNQMISRDVQNSQLRF